MECTAGGFGLPSHKMGRGIVLGPGTEEGGIKEGGRVPLLLYGARGVEYTHTCSPSASSSLLARGLPSVAVSAGIVRSFGFRIHLPAITRSLLQTNTIRIGGGGMNCLHAWRESEKENFPPHSGSCEQRLMENARLLVVGAHVEVRYSIG